MLLRSKCFFVFIVLLFTPCIVLSQEQGDNDSQAGFRSARFDDPCGDPFEQNTVWYPIKGKVSKVIDGNTVVVTYGENEVVRVHLVGISLGGSDSGAKAKKRLSSALLNKNVEVMVDTHWLFLEKKPKHVSGSVHMQEGGYGDIGLVLISEGLARFTEPPPYTMTPHTQCHYRLAEKEARAKKLGMWR